MEIKQDPETQNILQLRYKDAEGQLESLRADELAEALQGLSDMVSDFARAGAFGEGPPPELRVEPVEEGSVIINTFLEVDWAMTADMVTSLSPIGGLAWMIKSATKSMRARPADMEYLDSDTVKLTWSDGEVETIPARAWEELNRASRRKKHKRNLRKIMAPLSDDADFLEIRSGSATEVAHEVPQFIATRDDYRVVAYEEPDSDEATEVFDVETQVEAIDFEPDGKWRIRLAGGTRRATMEDEDFMAKIDRGLPIGKDDIFQMRIRVDSVTKNERRKNDYAIVKVLSHTQRSSSDDNTSAPPEHTD